MIAFSGVLSSWLMLARKRDLPAFRLSACSREASSAASRAVSVVASRTTAISAPDAVLERSTAQVRSGAPRGAKRQSASPLAMARATVASTLADSEVSASA